MGQDADRDKGAPEVLDSAVRNRNDQSRWDDVFDSGAFGPLDAECPLDT